jgi:GTPase
LIQCLLTMLSVLFFLLLILQYLKFGICFLGFNSKGECVNYSPLHNMTWGDIIENSYKVISFLDLAGHEKYLKTTVSGMTGHMPDYCFLLVGSNMGVTRSTSLFF